MVQLMSVNFVEDNFTLQCQKKPSKHLWVEQQKSQSVLWSTSCVLLYSLGRP